MHTSPGSGAAWGPGAILCVMRMMVMVQVMVIVVVVGVANTPGSVRRAGKHHQKQYGG